MPRYFVSEYTDGPATRWNVIDRQTQEWVRRFPTKEGAEAHASELEQNQQLEEAGKGAIMIRNELDRVRAERDSWKAQFESASAAASEYSEFWERHSGDFDQFGNYVPYSQMVGDLRAAKAEIDRLSIVEAMEKYWHRQYDLSRAHVAKISDAVLSPPSDTSSLPASELAGDKRRSGAVASAPVAQSFELPSAGWRWRIRGHWRGAGWVLTERLPEFTEDADVEIERLYVALCADCPSRCANGGCSDCPHG